MKTKKKNNLIDFNNLKPNKIDLLTREEEINLFKIIEKGKKEGATMREKIMAHDAKNKLIYSNIGLIVDISKRNYSSLNEAELIQYGITGLEGAINTYDYRIAKFSTHANLWIIQAIKRGIDNRERMIRIPTKTLDKIRLIKKAIDQLTRENGTEPSFNELSKYLKGEIDKDEIKDLLVMSQSTKSLDKAIYDDNKELDFVNDVLTADPNEYTTEESKLDAFYKLFNKLSRIDQHIFSLKYGIYDNKERNFSEISKELCITIEKVKKSLKSSEEYFKLHNIKI